MKVLAALMIVLSFSAQASTSPTTTLKCKSANYAFEVADIEAFSFASYSINGRQINGPDVEMEDSYLGERVIALSLSIDGQPKHIELAATKVKPGSYKGTLFFDKVSQIATCTRK